MLVAEFHSRWIYFENAGVLKRKFIGFEESRKIVCSCELLFFCSEFNLFSLSLSKSAFSLTLETHSQDVVDIVKGRRIESIFVFVLDINWCGFILEKCGSLLKTFSSTCKNRRVKDFNVSHSIQIQIFHFTMPTKLL